jgi:predicted  nucleic acid-binding Zn-ribbon protein
LSGELSALHALETTMLRETATSKQEGARVLAKEQQIVANNRFLEAKLAETMTMKEEQNIKLKSEIVIYKNKLQEQKAKMKEALSTFETEKINEMKQQIKDAIDLKDLEIAQLNEQVEIKSKQVTRLDSQVAELSQRFAVAEQEHEAEIAAR